MAEPQVLSIPSGMLRISKEGETDRIIYPVHAEGWRTIGWTVHAPEPEEVEEDEEGPGFVGDDDPDFPPPPPAEIESDESAVAEPVEEVLAVAAPEPLDLGGMTKAEIVAAVAERYGEHLDPGDTRAELVAQAEAIAALAAAGGDGSAGPSDPGVEADAAELELPPLL